MRARRDYQRKIFKNPFSRKKSVKNSNKLIYIVPILLLFGVFFLMSRVFEIANIEVIDSQTIEKKQIISMLDDQLTKKRWLLLNQNNLFFFSKNQFAKDFKKNFPLVKVDIIKRIPNTLVIRVEENLAPFYWQDNSGKYYVNNTGKILRPADTGQLIVDNESGKASMIRFMTTTSQYPSVVDVSSGGSISVGSQVLDEENVDFIRQLTERVKDLADFEINQFKMEGGDSLDIILETSEGWLIYFRLTEPLDQQFNKLLLILSQKINDRSNLDYIDLRFGEKVFYK